MTFLLMEVWARYGSGSVVVVIHSVWRWSAKLVKEYNVLCRVWKNKQVFAQHRSRNLAFQVNGPAYSKVEEHGTAWCVRETSNNLVYWNIMCWKIGGRWSDLNRWFRGRSWTFLNTELVSSCWGWETKEEYWLRGVLIDCFKKIMLMILCFRGSWLCHVSLALFYFIGQWQLWIFENTIHLFTYIGIKTRNI